MSLKKLASPPKHYLGVYPSAKDYADAVNMRAWDIIAAMTYIHAPQSHSKPSEYLLKCLDPTEACVALCIAHTASGGHYWYCSGEHSEPFMASDKESGVCKMVGMYIPWSLWNQSVERDGVHYCPRRGKEIAPWTSSTKRNKRGPCSPAIRQYRGQTEYLVFMLKEAMRIRQDTLGTIARLWLEDKDTPPSHSLLLAHWIMKETDKRRPWKERP